MFPEHDFFLNLLAVAENVEDKDVKRLAKTVSEAMAGYLVEQINVETANLYEPMEVIFHDTDETTS